MNASAEPIRNKALVLEWYRMRGRDPAEIIYEEEEP